MACSNRWHRKRKMGTPLVALLAVLVVVPAFSWERDCLPGTCRVIEATAITPAGFSEGVQLLLEVTDKNRVLVTALVTRAYHDRFYTTKPETYVLRAGVQYVPARDFFNDCCAALLRVDGSELATLKVGNGSQLVAKVGDVERIVGAFRAGTRAEIEYTSLLEGRGQTARFSMMGFSAAHLSLEEATAPSVSSSSVGIATILSGDKVKSP